MNSAAAVTAAAVAITTRPLPPCPNCNGKRDEPLLRFCARCRRTAL